MGPYFLLNWIKQALSICSDRPAEMRTNHFAQVKWGGGGPGVGATFNFGDAEPLTFCANIYIN